MHAFAIAVDLPDLSSERLAGAVAQVGRQFMLDPASAWRVDSSAGALSAAGMHHGDAAAPRRYLHRQGDTLTLFDGLPVDPRGEHSGHDAAALAGGWRDWAGELEGQFCAARLDLAAQRVELLLDTFGLVPVFVMRRGDGALLSSSVQAIRALLAPAEPDPLGVSTMLGLGWASRRHTLLRDVHALAGGGSHTLSASGGLQSTLRFGPAQLAHAHAGARVNADELAGRMGSSIASAIQGIQPVRCALTAGRDSRLLLAFMRARGLAADYYTNGWPQDPDVVWGRMLAERLGLDHRVLNPEENTQAGHLAHAGDLAALATAFIAQNDGLSSLGQLADQLELGAAPERLGVKLWGTGSEIGRAGPGDMPITIANVPALGHSRAIVTRALAMKADPYRELMTAEAQAVLDRSIERFVGERGEEGWSTREVADLFFTFERVGCHGATAPRRAARADDLFSPYCSRVYAEYCLALSPAERYVELPYHQLLSRVGPELYRCPFEIPLRPPQAWRAQPRAVRKLAEVARARARAGQSGWKHLGYERTPFAFEWFERSRDTIAELLAVADSPLWEFVERRRVRELLSAEPHAREGRLDGLLRVTSVFWYFHGPQPS